jgi:O-antigen/teichoic acid export membrane protein
MQFTRKHIIFSLIWKYLEQCTAQAIQFIISIALARLLMPDDFGVIALVTILISMANVFVTSGLNSALIQKKDSDDLDFSSVFWLSLGMAFFIYAVLFLIAPLIASFYEKEVLVSIVRIQGITLFIGVFNSIQGVVVAKNLLFKKMFYRSLIVSIPTGIFGISLAYNGFGVWSLVWQQMLGSILTYIFMQFVVKWKPKFIFSFARAKVLFNFGWKLLVSALIALTFGNLHNLIIGKFFSTVTLGFCNKGESFPKLLITNVNSSIQAVMFPVFSEFQNDKEKLKQIFRKSITLSSFIIFPLMILLAIVAEPTIHLVLGEKWLPSVFFLQAYCFIYALWPIHTNNLTVMNALGRSDLFLKIEIIKSIVNVLFVMIALVMFKSVYALIVALSISCLLCTYINAFPNKKLLNYGFLEQAIDILPSFVFSLIAGFIVFSFSFLAIPNFAIIILQVVLGLAIYILLAKIFKMESMDYFLEILKRGIK